LPQKLHTKRLEQLQQQSLDINVGTVPDRIVKSIKVSKQVKTVNLKYSIKQNNRLHRLFDVTKPYVKQEVYRYLFQTY
jgi:hypothetical protein